MRGFIYLSTLWGALQFLGVFFINHFLVRPQSRDKSSIKITL
jgi:hypothetical protein